MATNKLTALTLRNIKPKAKVYKLSDGEGLFLTVPPNGSPRWQLAYRFGGKPLTLSFGTFPATSLGMAREKREDARALLAKGIDPMSRHRVAKASGNGSTTGSFEAVGRDWYNTQKASWRPEYADDVLKIIEDDLFPDLGKEQVDRIEPPTLLTVLRKIENRGAVTMVRKAHGYAGRIFRHAIGLGLAIRDPSADIVDALTKAPRVKNHTKLAANELEGFFIQLVGYDGALQTKIGLEVIVHTMVRTTEARWARKSEFENLDGKQPLWRIPGGRMKMHREHLVPLAPQVVPKIKRLMSLAGNSEWFLPQLAPTKSKGQAHPVVSENTFLYALYRMGYHSRATVHGFRGTASTVLNEHEFNPDWIELQLAHVDEDKIRGTYNSAQWITGRRKMLCWWSDYLDKQKAAADLIG